MLSISKSKPWTLRRLARITTLAIHRARLVAEATHHPVGDGGRAARRRACVDAQRASIYTAILTRARPAARRIVRKGEAPIVAQPRRDVYTTRRA